MDALSLLFAKAEALGIISPFPAGREIPQRLSVYADDVIIFLQGSPLKQKQTCSRAPSLRFLAVVS
jgi:hypothetical protein